MNRRCGVSTSIHTANRMLDSLGWTSHTDLRKSVLLEPCLGDGEILVEAARRLIASVRAHVQSWEVDHLRPRIRGFEFHRETAERARSSLNQVLLSEGISEDSARLLSEEWVTVRDFLLETPLKVTHVAANPPYLRLNKIPKPLVQAYAQVVRPHALRGDISIAFLDRMRDWTSPDGTIVALVTDRWMFTQYGERFLEACRSECWGIEVLEECNVNPFSRIVGVSAAIVRFSRKKCPTAPSFISRRSNARVLLERLRCRHGTLCDTGCIVRVGPALGCGATFILEEDMDFRIEPELIRMYISRAALITNCRSQAALRIVVPFDRDGNSIELEKYPLFREWAERYRDKLAGRSQVKRGLEWWRTIDRIGPIWNHAPKLLLPEMTKAPLTTVDYTTSIPAHSVYSIWPSGWPPTIMARVLNAGLLHLTARGQAPTIKSNWYRFYKRFIVRTPFPSWSQLSADERAALGVANPAEFSECFKELFEFEPSCNALTDYVRCESQRLMQTNSATG